jgi:hypothetical protein
VNELTENIVESCHRVPDRLVGTVCRQEGGARAYRGKSLRAKQDCVAMQVFTACPNKPIPGPLFAAVTIVSIGVSKSVSIEPSWNMTLG